jgi:hypothetical protein
MAAVSTVALVVTAVAAVAAAGASYMAGQEQKKAAKAAAADRERARQEQKEAADIASAAEKTKMISEQRRAIREARVRNAKIMQAAENSGVDGSSGALGASGAINTNLSTVFADSRARNTAVEGINQHNQNASDYLASADSTIMKGNANAAQWQAFAGIATAVGSFSSSAAFSKLFGPSTPSMPKSGFTPTEWSSSYSGPLVPTAP